MNIQRSILAVACAGALAAFAAGSAMAQQGDVNAQGSFVTQLTQQYAGFAGSDGNAAALVQGLHGGHAFTLQGAASAQHAGSAAGSVAITPKSGAMSYADVGQAIGLAQAQLAKLGITQPSPQQIAGALNGGTLATAQGNLALAGVLPVHSQVRDWAQVAQRIGVPFDAQSALAMQGGAQAHTGMAHMGADAARQGMTMGADAARQGMTMGADAARQGMTMGSDAARQGMAMGAGAARQGADAARQAANAAKGAAAVQAGGSATLGVQPPQAPPRPERPPVQRPPLPSMPGFGGH